MSFTDFELYAAPCATLERIHALEKATACKNKLLMLDVLTLRCTWK